MCRDIDKSGYTGTNGDPLIRVGDPMNRNPTTHVTFQNLVLDLNGNAKKDSLHVVNAKNTLIDGYHHELSAFKTMLLIEQSYGTELRSEEHTSELKSLMRSSYAVFCLKKKKNENH